MLAAAPPFMTDPALACRSRDPELWFPEGRNTGATAAAKRLCRNCPKRDECLTWALRTRQVHGIYDARTPAERAHILQGMQGRRT